MQPDLPETYYLDNVLTLFDHVTRVYADLLEKQQLEFLQGFAALGRDAKMLFIRLQNRSPNWYRADKLAYREIDSIDAAIAELAEQGFLEVNGEIDHPTLLSLYTMPELRAIMTDDSSLKQLKRAELEQALLESDDDVFFEQLRKRDTLLQVLRADEYLLCQMLFFGNLNQSMTDFVLRDLGMYQFESYSIDTEHRPYRSTLEIQQHWMLYQLETLFELSDKTDRSVLTELTAMIPPDIEPLSPAYRKCQQLRYQVARQLERIGTLSEALEQYRQCSLPPARERIARIHDQQGRPQDALDQCMQIIEQPIDEEELQFASMFAGRLIKRHGFETQESIESLAITHQPEIIELPLAPHDSVEIAVAEYYVSLDDADSCYYVENSIFNGVLGLLIWEAVFAPLPGAFYNPFQYRPADFYEHDFCARRQDLLAQTWTSISSNDDIWRIVSKRWVEKQDLMNPLVNWQSLDLDLIELALERIDYQHWTAIFKRILRDLRNNRSGFPDLVRFPPAGGYCLIEVKGPGDSLQKNQRRWMQYFHEHGIPHQLARVTWQTH
ncbi:MAG: VRR-NUC domain-containing protein [Gammaproteobacteria bacterium]|nr:VRR-NUC domain-containing protein [Gammaproteobacteria bacterium]MDH3856720.1 VRR-NUC domain-containing protein [Gammaproteobacteria bacterium]